MRYSQLWALTAFGFSLVVNPGYFAGCASADEENAPDYTVLTAQMSEVVLSANDSYNFSIDNVAYRLDVDVEPVRAAAAQAQRGRTPFMQTAHACGTVKLVATAQACLDTYKMDVTGHVTLLRALGGDNFEEVASAVAVTGSLDAISTAFATLTLRFEGGSVVLQKQNAGQTESFQLGAHDVQSLIDG